jgi:serine/threonine protein kinase
MPRFETRESDDCSDRWYLWLTNFAFAKKVYGRAYTYCSTSGYVSPDIILNRAYEKPSNWWALGIVI